FTVVGIGTYSREFAREVRAAADKYGVEPLITDDYLEVEARVAELQPELVLGTQMERHIAKRLGVPCAVISAPVHVQDFPARYSPQMGFEGANVIFDTWVHPLMMGLEEHLLAMFRDDVEFHDGAAPSHLGGKAQKSQDKPAEAIAPEPVAAMAQADAAPVATGAPITFRWDDTAEKELSRLCMTPKLTSPAEATPMRVVLVTMDTHVASAIDRARVVLAKQIPGLSLRVHAASEFAADAAALQRCLNDIEQGDIIINTMLFMEDHFTPLLPLLNARRTTCDAMLCALSAAEVTRLTRIGQFDMSAPANGAMALLKKLRGPKEKTASAGANQMKMLRRLPKILRFIPGTAQDVRAYFLAMQYWLAGSEENMVNMVLYLVDRYADGPRRHLRGKLKVQPPVEYPDVGVYHPRMDVAVTEDAGKLPAPKGGAKATVGLLLMRSYVLARNAGHYDGMIAALEARGLRVIPAFAAGLDARPAIEKFFMKDGQPTIDAMMSLMGFSLVGGPAAAHPVEFQTMEQWQDSDRGLLPVESTIMVAIPELDGSTGPAVFGGRADGGTTCGGCERQCVFPKSENARDMHVCAERASRKVGVVLFNFPPNAGNTGTAAYLSVFESLYRVLHAMKGAGYTVEPPASVDALRCSIIEGNAKRFG
ncbi:MAG: DUF3479 domain-containing protein, partial [Proteobacteria bacterium]|nr:DUF3479 domain-containing protein [Pseudomonadota bacterium]